MVAQANSRFSERRHGERRVVDDARFPRPPILRPAVPVKLSLGDRWSIAWSARRMMAVVFAVAAVIGLCAALVVMKPEYVARMRLVAPEGIADLYGQGAPVRDHTAILKSDALAKTVIGQIGARRLFPDLDGRGESGRVAAVSAFKRALSVRAMSGGDEIEIAIHGRDSHIAALAVDKLAAAYASYQRQANIVAEDAPLAEQRRALDTRMALAGEAMRAFLKAHNLGDYETDLDAATALANALAHDVAVGKAELAEIEARLQSANAAVDGARLNTDLAARAKKVAALQQEMIAASARANRLRALAPEYERLRFAQDSVTAAAVRLSAKDEDARGVEALRSTGAFVFRPVGAPSVGRVGRGQLSVAIFAALAFAAVAAACAGLVRSLGAKVLPTPSAAERHLGVPVLVVAPQVSR